MAKRIVWAEGHYGSATCSECGANCDKEYKKCPKCKVRFDELDTLADFGGSDF